MSIVPHALEAPKGHRGGVLAGARRVTAWGLLAAGLAWLAAVASAPADGALFYYGGKPVTVAGLTLVKGAAATAMLRRFADDLQRPPNGVWPREEAAVGPAAPGYYLPRRGASRLEVVTHVWRLFVEGAVLDYLSMKVQDAYLAKYPFDLAKYYHLRRVKAYLTIDCRLSQRQNDLYAQCAEQRWGPAKLAAGLRRDFPGASFSPIGWAKVAAPLIRSEPAWYLVGAGCFPQYRGGHIAVYCAAPFHAVLLLPAMLHSVRARRSRFALMVAKRFGKTPFVVVREPMGAWRAAAAIARLCVGANANRDEEHLQSVHRTLSALVSPTAFDRGFGGNSMYFTLLTGLSADMLRARKLIACKRWAHHYLYISDVAPRIAPAPAFFDARPPSFLWDAGVDTILTPICKRVLANFRPAVRWLKKPSVKALREASRPSVGLPALHMFGVALPEFVRKPYRNYKWQTSVPMANPRP